MKRYIPYEVNFDSKVIGDKETIRVQGVMLEHPEGPYVNFTDVERLIAERDAAVKALKWAMKYGANWCNDSVFHSGCGCCSGELEVPDDLKAAIDAARGENENL